MSVADNFKFYGAFPVCLDDVADSAFDYFGGLTLAEVMSIWWLIENVTFESSGYLEEDQGGTLFGVDINKARDVPAGETPFSVQLNSFLLESDPSTPVEPYRRVCIETKTAVNFTYGPEDDGYGNTNFRTDFSAYVGIDPDDASKYALFYSFDIRSSCSGGSPVPGARLMNPAGAAVLGYSGTPEFSGTAVFGAATMDWVGGGTHVDSGEWVSGGAGFALNVGVDLFTFV